MCNMLKVHWLCSYIAITTKCLLTNNLCIVIHYSVFLSSSLYFVMPPVEDREMSRTELKKNGRNKDWAEKKDRNGWVMDETRHILSLVTHCVTQKSDASQTVKYWTLSLYFLPVCQQWININSVDESRCIFVMLVTQKQSQQWKKTCSLCGCSLEANDWQTGELVATGSSNDDLSPTNH